MKVRPETDELGQIWGYSFLCPGCNHRHVYYVTGNMVWSFNGDVNNPTFTPSLLNTNGKSENIICDDHIVAARCHLFVTNGEIQFCSDSTHSLAGKVVQMEDMKKDG